MLNGLKCFIHRWPILAKFRIVNNRHVFENVEATSEAYLSESARSPEYPPSYACVACLGGVNHFVFLACRTTTSAVHLEIMTPRWTCFTNNLLYLGLFCPTHPTSTSQSWHTQCVRDIALQLATNLSARQIQLRTDSSRRQQTVLLSLLPQAPYNLPVAAPYNLSEAARGLLFLQALTSIREDIGSKTYLSPGPNQHAGGHT